MASIPSSNLSGSSLNNGPPNTQHSIVPLAILTILFFMWGFITVLNDILIPHLKAVFDLTHFQASAVQFAFFGAYGVVSYPAGSLIKHIGYKKGVVLGLLIAGIGCLLFYPAGTQRVYGLFLTALFVLAAGITVLQVAANPFVTRLGNPEGASLRLTFTQAFNSLGTTLGPIFGAVLIFSAATVDISALSAVELDAHRQHEAEAVQLPYLILAASLIGLAVVFALLKNLPVIVDAEADQGHTAKTAWQHRHLVLGALGIFLYVGAEVSIGSFIVDFLGDPNVANMPKRQAGSMISFYWGAAMVGRFVGVALMLKFPPQKLLSIAAASATVLLITASLSSGYIAVWSVLAIGLFNAIMFPVIFSLAINKLGPATSQGSGILCVAIVGGAIVPPLQGLLADSIGLQVSFLLPVLCYLYIGYYGLKGYRIAPSQP
ncbi:sugar MFS transporter [Teredinibacter purpureus]|uniref:sugar MFS transporter n=1 Tax=Teredinibacter purpureus TaxID=2731756 RepID=UPI0005F870AD|nr:sugar MFS transporter [Teredinibacter purpureus]